MASGSTVVSTVPTRQRHLKTPQSKHGCFTCRARRKKCGEERPACMRCINARRICEGYRTNEFVDGKVLIMQRVVSTRFYESHDHARLSQLGQELLLQQVHSDSLAISSEIWTVVLPQLNVVNQCVNAAITCLGSVYDHLILQSGIGIDLVCRHYRKAILLLKDEISICNHNKAPIFLTCVVLAAVEVLQRRLINAMMHLRGAFQVAAMDKPVGEDDTLYHIAQAFDIQTATYALGQPPDLPISGPFSYINISRPAQHVSWNNIHSELLPLLHACYHYCYQASSYKYSPPNEIPQLMILDQGRYIALLSQWIAALDHVTDSAMNPTYEHAKPASHTIIMRLQCIAAIIYLSSVLDPFEKDYDAYTAFFQQIINGASSVLNSKQPGNLNSPAHRFRILSPLAQPLYLTVMKCRNKPLRQEAIKLLGLTGREGPWDSRILVRIAQRVVDMEHRSCEDIDVPERARIHGCGVMSEIVTPEQKANVEMEFSRCVDVDSMITRTGWQDPVNWEIWREVLPA